MSNEYDCIALLAICPNLSGICSQLESSISNSVSRARTRLIIWLQSEAFSSSDSPRYRDWHEIHRLLIDLYTQAVRITHRCDKVLLEVDIILRESLVDFELPGSVACDALFVHREGELIKHDPNTKIATILEQPESSSSVEQPSFFKSLEKHPVVAMGGTFDHLHMGHKILLSLAALLVSSKLIVGMTDDSLLVNKKYKEVLQDLPTRIQHTREFLDLFKSGIEYALTPINDVYGPTGWDPNVQGLIVTRETLSGASAIAKHRREKNLPPLEEYVVDVIAPAGVQFNEEDPTSYKELKISSTAIREMIVKSQHNNKETSSKSSQPL